MFVELTNNRTNNPITVGVSQIVQFHAQGEKGITVLALAVPSGNGIMRIYVAEDYETVKSKIRKSGAKLV